jgi:hypothetical protein
MVDKLDHLKYENQVYRVDAARDALEEEREESQGEDGEEGKSDNFDKLKDGKELQSLFNKSHLWQRNIAIKTEDIDKIKLIALNINTEPSLLKIRVFLFDGTTIPTAFLSVSRSLALKLRSSKSQFIEVNWLTREPVLRVTVPKNERDIDEEITKITHAPKEHTLSQTLKMFVSKKSWLQKLGLQDPVSMQINNEILWVYITIVALISVLSFGVLYMLL